MTDPRLIEIELLSKVETTTVGNTAFGYNKFDANGSHDQVKYAALVNLLVERALVSDTHYKREAYKNEDHITTSLKAARIAEVEMDGGGVAHLWITPVGRLRLYRLRDEMLNKDRVRDDFGILWSARHFEPDLEVKQRFHGFPSPFTLMLIDVDRLKGINTEFGHVKANDILREIFNTLQAVIAPYEGYRIGGDELAGILPGVGAAKAKELAEDLRARIYDRFQTDRFGDGHSPSVSIGVGTSNDLIPAHDFYEWVDKHLLYAAKKDRNAVRAEERFANAA